jgi:hypothetical protein
MSYKLEAFILNHKAAEMLPDYLRHLHCFRLNDQLALVPSTRQLYKEVVATFGEAKDDPYDDTLFIRLHPVLAQIAAKISSVSPVLYLEADVVNGIGDRTAIVWHKGEAAYGPSEGSSFLTEALRLFGQMEGLSFDQIGELGIFRYRFTEDWVQPVENDSDES